VAPSLAPTSQHAARLAAHLHHAEAPLLAQHAGLVVQHVLEAGTDELPLLGHTAVKGHALRVAAQPRLHDREMGVSGGSQGDAGSHSHQLRPMRASQLLEPDSSAKLRHAPASLPAARGAPPPAPAAS
jgi:hypothetical protein